MSEDKPEKDILRPHQYDGIQEYDNQLPKWWLYGFYLSIAFAIGYFYWFQMSESGLSLWNSFEQERSAIESAQKELQSQKKGITEEGLLAIAQRPDTIKKGRELFAGKCASCHAADGGGLVGPNLTDNYWIHGNKMSEMVKVITEGVPAKGMPTWGALLSEDEIHAAAAFVKSLHGTTPAVPKKAEGNLINP